MITHEEARKELEYFQQCVGLKLNKVNDYITQQEKKDERAKKVEELLKYQSNYINSIIDSLNVVIDKSKLSQDMMANELEEMK